MLKAFKFELNPNDDQKAAMSRQFGCARFVFNFGLNEKSKVFKETGKTISCFDLIKRVTAMKKDEAMAWLGEVHSQTLQMSLRNLDNAYTNFFSKRGSFPKFKSRKGRQSFQYPQGVKMNGNKVFLPKIGWVAFFKSRDIVGKIKTVTVSKTPTGRHFVSVLCETGATIPAKKEIKKSTSVGIDLGIKDFLHTSEGQMFENQKHLIRSLKKLRTEQRTLARKVKGSNRREKQRLVVAKVYERVANQRRDFLHKTSTSLINRFDTICIEDLNVCGMIKNRKLAKHIQDCGWATFRSMLEYKCEWRGKNLLVIGRYEPSSKTCNHCGHIHRDLKLSDRVWTCSNCQRTLERDFNAALNIKDFGLGQNQSQANVSH